MECGTAVSVTLSCVCWGAGCVFAAELQAVRLNNNTAASKTETVFFMVFPFCLSKTVLRQPGHCLFDQVGDVPAVGSDDRLLFQSLVEIDMLDFRNGVFQIVVVI